jgi:hypothetical protein
VPFRIVPERSEAPEDFVQSASAKGSDVFDDDVARADFFDEAVVFVPESTSFAGESCAVPCDANVLARESPADDVDCVMDIFRCKGLNVIKNRHVRPVFFEYLSAYGIDFAERNGLHSCALKAERKAAYARK